jgi:hypothetical protein
LVPIGALDGKDDEIAVGREFDVAKTHGIEKIIKCEFWFGLRDESKSTSEQHCGNKEESLDSHLGSRSEEGLYIGEFGKGKFSPLQDVYR